jgi:hypothetical protein
LIHYNITYIVAIYLAKEKHERSTLETTLSTSLTDKIGYRDAVRRGVDYCTFGSVLFILTSAMATNCD